MDDCIFCKIVKGEIPSAKTYEDEKYVGFLDINPIKKGHMLLIPKQHIVWMQDASEATIKEIFALATSLMKKMISNIPCDYVEVVVEGQDVPHFHIHLVPRIRGEKVGTWIHEKYESSDEMNQFANKIVTAA